eukprot:GHRQ01005876.1.p1 GENE.GHRQ01005876.1~~GHRQ01005876.1.p1  ORF type:complete len:271 (+),score=51.02 GHRQ01005876.1:97-909(+)
MYNQYRPPTGGFGGPPPPPFGGPPAPAYGQFGGAPPGPAFGGGGPSSHGGAGRDANDDKLSKVKDPLLTAVRWLKGRSPQEKLVLGCLAGVVVLLILWRTIEDHDTLFVLAEVAHFVGIGLLAFKMYSKRSAAGLSAQTQILTTIFLIIRLYCSFMMEYDIHTILDGMTLLATVGVLYALWFTPIKATYQADLDNVKFYYVVRGALPLQQQTGNCRSSGKQSAARGRRARHSSTSQGRVKHSNSSSSSRACSGKLGLLVGMFFRQGAQVG